MRAIVIIWFVLRALSLFSQDIDPQHFDYAAVDSFVMNLPDKTYKSTEELAEVLTKNFDTDHEKFRAIYVWVSCNLDYNLRYRGVTNPKTVMRKKKAVCIGYACLLKNLCDYALDMESCKLLLGSSHVESRGFRKVFTETGHAWNAVWLYGKWYLVDATWASGTYDETTNVFTKKFNDFYFLTPPEEFISGHLPEENKWQLLDENVSKSEFRRKYALLAEKEGRKKNAIPFYARWKR